MTDSPGLTPEHDAVRRLLADVRHDGPTPPDVVARLDDTLASLVAEQATLEPETAQARTAPVVDLGARRRRLIGAGVLAAAAVVVAGVALGQALPDGQGSDDAGSSAGGSTSLAEDDSSAGATADGEGGGDSSAQEMAPQSKSAQPAPLASVPTLSSGDADLEQRVEALRSTAPSSARAERRQMLDLMRTCPLPELGRGRRVVAEVDGQPGLVFFPAADDDVQGVAIYVCGTPQPVRTLTLPAP
jgi:hypothetical protein